MVVSTEIEHACEQCQTKQHVVIQTQVCEYGLSHFPSHLLKLISAHPIIMVIS